MQGRAWIDTTSTYRYGFNGKEKDASDEWGSMSYDYGFRIYNPIIGRFLSVDPLTKSYPWYTPYQFAGNTPIWANDLDGLEPNYPGTLADYEPVLTAADAATLTSSQQFHMTHFNAMESFYNDNRSAHSPALHT